MVGCLDADAVCRSFDLGVPSRPAEPLAGGSSVARWKVHTSRGRWMVKAVGSPASWQLDQMRVSGIVERAAYVAGVPMPRPVEPSGAAAGYWALLCERDLYARASRWVDGTPPDSPAGAGLAGWLGRTLAAIEGLALPGDPATEAAYPVHSVADWHSWLDQAMTAGVLGRGQKGAALAAGRWLGVQSKAPAGLRRTLGIPVRLERTPRRSAGLRLPMSRRECLPEGGDRRCHVSWPPVPPWRRCGPATRPSPAIWDGRTPGV